MIGDDPVRHAARAFRLDLGEIGDVGDDGAEQIDLVVVVGALQHRSDALQPHAGVDRGPRQRDALAGRHLLELHEHQVPDLDEAVAVGLGRARWPAGNARTVIVEDLRAWAARAEVAHLPEIVGPGDAHDPALGQSRNLAPEVECLVVVDEDGDRQAVGRKPELPGDEVPCELDGAILEVIAEREVPEHLEEGVVARGIADIVEVVVLAARAHAFLRSDRAQVGTFSRPVKTFLNCTIPALVNIRVGSFRGTSGEDGTTSWPLRAK